MKRFKSLLLALVFCGFVGTVSYAQPRDSYSNLGPVLLHRNGISTDDASYPTTSDLPSDYDNDTAGVPFYCGGYTHVRVFADISGTSVSVTPLYYMESSGSADRAFYPGTATTVTADKVYTLEVDQGTWLYLDCDVTTATISLWLQGIERRGY